MKNIVCLISGRGSNLKSLLRTACTHHWEQTLSARFAAVISNKPNAPGLMYAIEHDIPSQTVSHRDFPARDDFDQALMQAIDQHQPDLIILAGFMRILTPAFVNHYQGRLINIHPSLLPSFPGLDTHARALAAGVRLHGSTVHYVTGELDAGPIIAQACVPVEPTDTEDDLAARVLQQEHRLLPQCVEWILSGQVRLENGRVISGDLNGTDLCLGTP
jgi:phosphoribosylglycinamide formyltransferase-1